MSELDNLRPEVREAVRELDGKAYPGSWTHERWQTIRAELLRLAKIEKEYGFAIDCERRRAEEAEPELAALKGRIADAPCVGVWGVQGVSGLEPSYTVQETPAVVVTPLLAGKRVRLVVEE